VRGSRVRRHAGIATGIYHPGEIDQADRADHQLLTPASAYSETLIAFARAGRL
jgi:hypothetical protein